MKHIIILGDGMADEPLAQLGGRTPLQVAVKPTIDRLAKEGRCGMLHTVPDGYHPGSEVAHLSLLGYDLPSVFEGRGSLEAASMGVDIEPGEMAMRCNLICVEDGKIKNHSAGHITDAEAAQLIDYLNEQLGDDDVRFFNGVSYRHLLKIRGGDKRIVCIMSLLCLYRNRLMKASLYFGIALAFKLQAVFIAPFLFTFYLNYRLHIHKGFKAKDALLFIIPIMVVWLSGIVAYCYGRNPFDVFSVYFEQIDSYDYICLNCPNLWGLFITLSPKTQLILIDISLVICFAVLLCEVIYTLRHNILNHRDNFLATATWFAWTTVMLLPKMHERYTFMIDILLVLLSFTNRRFVKYAAISLAVSIWIYYKGPLLSPIHDRIVRSIISSAAYMFFTYSLVHASKHEKDIQIK